MSTMCMGETGLNKIAQAAVWLAYNGHKTTAYSDAARQIYSGAGVMWHVNNPSATKEEIIERVIDMLSVFNQRAFSVAYAHMDEFYKCERFKITTTRLAGDYDLTTEAAIDAYKQLQALSYNLDGYINNNTVENAVNGLKKLFINFIIHDSEAYKNAHWGA